MDSYTELVVDLHRTELCVHQFDYDSGLAAISPLVRRRREPYPDAGWTAEMAARNIEYLSSGDRYRLGQVALSPPLPTKRRKEEERQSVTARRIAARLSGQTEGIEATAQCMHALVQLRVDPANLQVRTRKTAAHTHTHSANDHACSGYESKMHALGIFVYNSVCTGLLDFINAIACLFYCVFFRRPSAF